MCGEVTLQGIGHPLTAAMDLFAAAHLQLAAVAGGEGWSGMLSVARSCAESGSKGGERLRSNEGPVFGHVDSAVGGGGGMLGVKETSGPHVLAKSS